MMRLADFILGDMDAILVEWEAFARTLLPAARTMDVTELRDHAREMLSAIATDLVTSQTREAQAEKSKGRAAKPLGAPATAAQTHALLRARSGFNINQLAAEYRALRASVLRLWLESGHTAPHHLDDTIRFSEAIDQALAESIDFFSQQVEQTRNLLLGMLGHDMRSPLQAIRTTAGYLAQLNAGAEVSKAASLLISSGASMQRLLDDLVDFSRTNMGMGISISPTPVDAGEVAVDKLEQICAAFPHRKLEWEVSGDLRGLYDAHRLQQMIGNLVENAIKHGAPGEPVRVRMLGGDSDLLLEVRNFGPPIDPSFMVHMFEPLLRGPKPANHPDAGGLGLGLYIAREIAKAHRGEIEARSDATETVFSVRLPSRNTQEQLIGDTH